MATAIALALAAALAAGEGTSPPDPGAPPRGAFVLSLSAGPAWMGGRVGVGGLALDDVSGPGAFVGGEALVRVTPVFAYGLSVEGMADAPVKMSAPTCGEGAGRGCDAAYTRFSAIARWSYHRAGSREGWVSASTGHERLRIASYGADARELEVRGWEIASVAVGLDWAATPSLGVGVFASGSAGVFTRVIGGDAGASVRAPHYALRAGIRGVAPVGEAWFPPRSPLLAAPEGTALFVEGRLGAAWDFGGAMLGLAAGGRAGPLVAGAFAEVAVIPFENFPSETAPAEARSSAFAGGFAGAAARLGRRGRVELDGEIGVRRSYLRVDHWHADDVSDSASVAFAGGRVKLDLGLEPIAFGVSAFVREPLHKACVDVGDGCERLGTTVGVVLHGSFTFLRRGAAASTSTAIPTSTATSSPIPTST